MHVLSFRPLLILLGVSLSLLFVSFIFIPPHVVAHEGVAHATAEEAHIDEDLGSFIPQAHAQEPQVERSTNTAAADGAPVITESSFPPEGQWSNQRSGTISWELPENVESVAVELVASPEAEPIATYNNPPIDTIELTAEDLSEGVQYLAIQFREGTEWGPIRYRKLMIDTEAPRAVTIGVHTGGQDGVPPLLTFDTTDEPSGIDRYEVSVGGDEMTLTPAEAAEGYFLSDREDGTYLVTVTAIDHAGNVAYASRDVTVAAGWTPATDASAAGGVLTAFEIFTDKNLIIAMLLLMLMVLFGYDRAEESRRSRREERLREETREVEMQMQKVFTALRNEIYQQINALNTKKRLTKKEQEVIGGLNQALEVSETMIEKEISDVNKLLRKKQQKVTTS